MWIYPDSLPNLRFFFSLPTLLPPLPYVWGKGCSLGQGGSVLGFGIQRIVVPSIFLPWQHLCCHLIPILRNYDQHQPPTPPHH